MKKYLAIFLAVIMLFTVVGTMTVASAETSTFNILDVKNQIRTVGRTSETTSGIKLDWTASGIEFSANCEGDVALTITATCQDVGNKGTYNKDCYFTVYIDGVRQSYRVRTMNGTYTVNIAEGLSSGEHTFKVLKQNEKVTTSATITAITLNGTLGQKPADPQYVIEFLGDSITSGFGSLDTNNQASRYSDGTRTYAYIIAENFGAEARVVSQSGDTITGILSKYTSGYDYSLKKPNLVSIAFGTNDGTKSVDYWKGGLKNIADAVRTGYNDNSIPIVFIHNLMTNSDLIRANVAEGIRQLQAEDAEKYSNIFVTSGNNPQGGHPPQASHLTAANKITRDIVDFGVFPASALRSDATITLTPAATETENLKTMDTVVAPSNAAITGELVDPLDPADEGSETAKAVKYTADGTQSATSTYQNAQVSLGRINNSGLRTNGISFYINYKDTTDYTGVEEPTYSKPKLLFSASDQTTTFSLNVEQGVTQKVELYWNTMPNTNYVLQRMTIGNNPLIALEMLGKCEYTIDNVKVLLNKYTYATNANRAYTYTSGYNSYPLMGVTENYAPETTTTTTTTTVAPTVPADGSYVFEAENLSKTSQGSTGTFTGKDDYNCGTNVFVTLDTDNPSVGHYVEYTLPSIEAGTYKLSVPTRATPTRSSFNISVNGTQVASNVSFAYTDGTAGFVADYVDIDCGNITVSQTGDVTLRFTISTAGTAGFYMDKIKLTKVTDDGDDTEEPSSEPSSSEPSSEPSSSEPSSEPSSSSTSVTTPSEEVPEESSSSTIPAGTAKAKIGDTEYASLFGADGALANAQAGDRIVMVADETFTYTASHCGTLMYLSKNITLDLAGHTVATTTDNSSNTENVLIATTAPFTVVSTVDGLGAENTATKGVLSAKATVVSAGGNFTANNVEIRSSLTGDSYGMAIGVAANITVTLKDSTIYAPKHAISVGGGNGTFDVDNCSISAQYYPLSSNGKTFAGIMKNSKIFATNAYGPRIRSNDLELNNCNLYINGYDQNVIELQAGNLILTNGTVVNCGSKAKVGIKLNASTSIETSNATIKSPKNASGAYALQFATGATATLGEGTVVSASGNAKTSNVSLYPFAKEGYALYKSSTASEDTLIAEDYDYTAYNASIYVLEALNTKATVTIDGVEVDFDGTEFVFPDTADFYMNDNGIYTAGESIEVSEDIEFTSYDTALAMQQGASIRLNQTNGIRFHTDVNADVIAALKDTGATVTLGTLITPADLLGDKDLTFDCGVNIANVVYAADLGGKWNIDGFVGSIVNIKDSNAYNAQTGNIGRDFVGRGYVTVTVGETSKTIYADYYNDDVESNSRSVAFVANAFKSDETSDYNSLSDTVKALVDKWAKVFTDMLG